MVNGKTRRGGQNGKMLKPTGPKIDAIGKISKMVKMLEPIGASGMAKHVKTGRCENRYERKWKICKAR